MKTYAVYFFPLKSDLSFCPIKLERTFTQRSYLEAMHKKAIYSSLSIEAIGWIKTNARAETLRTVALFLVNRDSRL